MLMVVFWLGSARLILVLPWAVFLGLGIVTARLLYEAWQEQAALDALAEKIKQEKLLSRRKQSFAGLSSHYLRTPLTLITAGVEAAAAPVTGQAAAQRLKVLGERLNTGVNGLLEQASRPIAEPGRSIKQLPNLTAYMTISLGGAFVIICLAVYLLNRLDFTAFKFNNIAAETGVVALAGLLVYSLRRTRAARRLVKRHFEELLQDRRRLDKQRNELVRGSLETLNQPLEEFKAALKPFVGRPELRPIESGVASFEGVLKQFLILSSLESGQMSTIFSRISLKKLLGRISERYRRQLEAKKLHIRSQLKADELEQDELLLEFVLGSIIENAIQYSPEGGHVDVICRPAGKFVDIFIRDEGPGVEAGKLELLFQPFSRAEDIAGRFEHEGLGLSLYLDRLIIHYLGGEIKARNGKTKGFTVMLRLKNLDTKAIKK